MTSLRVKRRCRPGRLRTGCYYNSGMQGFAAILIGAALANNAALAYLLGLDPALHGERRLLDAARLALATGGVLVAAAIVCWLIERFLLTPFDLDWLHALVWLLVVTALAPWPRALLGRHGSLPALSPLLLIGNGLVLGALALNAHAGFIAMAGRTLGIVIGFGIVLLLFTAMHDRLNDADVPAPFRGTPILLITAAIMALAFMGFTGFGR